VVTCPTGIDIRDGLQMECIHCTQCIDACDAIMDRVARPRGLIRYASRDELAGAPSRVLRPRIVIYPLILIALWGSLGWALAHRPLAEVTVLRGLGSPFTVLPSGEISNQIRIKVENHGSDARHYQLSLADGADLRLVAPENPIAVAGGQQATATVFVIAFARHFASGERPVRFRISDSEGLDVTREYRLLGPSTEESR
jgi:polyferredoxin